MKKKIICSILAILLLIIFILTFNTDKAKIIRGNMMYGTSNKCNTIEVTTAEITHRICHICLHSFEGSSSEKLCRECSQITNRCRVCGKSREVLYSTIHYFSMGSRGIKIYKNGDVFEDIEIEEPNHKPEYKYLKTLNIEEMKNLEDILENDGDSENIKNSVLKLVYGNSLLKKILYEIR